MLQIIGSLLEWILGNTFPFVVFASYGKLEFDIYGVECNILENNS
jgi:succinate-acetate transporter protein